MCRACRSQACDDRRNLEKRTWWGSSLCAWRNRRNTQTAVPTKTVTLAYSCAMALLLLPKVRHEQTEWQQGDCQGRSVRYHRRGKRRGPALEIRDACFLPCDDDLLLLDSFDCDRDKGAVVESEHRSSLATNSYSVWKDVLHLLRDEAAVFAVI